MVKKINVQLFLSFLKIGLFTFGGGYAMIPLIKEEICTKQNWLKEEEIYDITALAEMTPGPVAVNAATFVGSKLNGASGAFWATLAVIIPSFFIICALGFIPQRYTSSPPVIRAFFGIRAAVLSLVIHAAYRLWKTSRKDFFFYILLIVNSVSIFFLRANIFLLLGLSGIAGIIHSSLTKRKHS